MWLLSQLSTSSNPRAVSCLRGTGRFRLGSSPRAEDLLFAPHDTTDGELPIGIFFKEDYPIAVSVEKRFVIVDIEDKAIGAGVDNISGDHFLPG